MEILIGLAILAAALVVVAIVSFVSAAGLASGGQMKLGKGAAIKMDEIEKRTDLVGRLRIVSVVCLVLAAAVGVGIYTFLNYAANP